MPVLGLELRNETLDSLPASVPGPQYDRSRVAEGIVHFGVGGFHRAHEAMYLERLLNRGLASEFGIVGVGTMPQDVRMRDTLSRQDGLYTLVVKHPDGRREPQVIGSVLRFMYAPDDPAAVVEVLRAPSTRIVSLTITEGGYLVEAGTGGFAAGNPLVAADLAPGAVPTTPVGFIVQALRLRRQDGTAPFTVMSCDNIPGNGAVARAMVTGFARVQDPDLADWIGAYVQFPSSMVDRITPVTAAEDIEELRTQFGVDDAWPVVCEPFTQWVLEDAFQDGAAGRPAWQDAGVQMVPDVEPYELMKLRLLNASHQAMCYLGFLSGYRYAHEVAADPLFVDFLLGYMAHEGTPTLPPVPGVDLDAYQHQLIDRFANPEVRDTLARLCAESSDRIPTWLVPVIRSNLAAGGPIDRSALVVASWARYAEGVDEQGRPIDVVDQLKEQVMAAAARQHDNPLAFVENEQLFGDLAADHRFADSYRRWLSSLHEVGARATLQRLAAKE